MSEITNEDLINFDDYPAMVDNQNNNDDDFFSNPFLEENNEHLDDPFENGENNSNLEIESEIIRNLLSQKGITDPSKIQIEDEDGNISEVDFSSLPIEEQLEILQYEEPLELEDIEIETINYLRENNVSLEDLINHQRNLAVQEYLQSQNQTFTIDNLSDEELYRLDIKSKYKNLSEDEVNIELQKELNSPDIFKKKIENLRELYKQEELEEQNRLKLQEESEIKEEYDNFVNSMVEIAENTNELFDLELEDSDKEEVLQFLLAQDINGQSEFVKILNDPNQLFNLAWFALKGKEAFDTIHDYYKKEIDSARKKVVPSITSRKTIVKKENTKGNNDPYDLNQIFNN